MVVRIQLTIKHIRGHTFPVDADVETDVLGLKVQIWESQKIPIEGQRLVFGGKELQDNTKLAEYGIGDNGVIFLVESNSEIPQQPQAEVQPVTVQVPIQSQINASPCVTTATYAYPYHQQPLNVNSYEPIDDETVLSEERMQSVIDLAFWVRRYCILGMIITAISSFACLYCLIPFAMCLLGFLGTRKLNRCLLFFPLLLTMIIGFGLLFFSIDWLFSGFHASIILLIFIALLHLMIFASICKLMCRIGKLSCQEWWQARVRIQSKCCCC